MLFVVQFAGEVELVAFLRHAELLPYTENVIEAVVCLLAGKGVGECQPAAFVGVYLCRFFAQVHIHFPAIAQAALCRKVLYERACLRIETDVGILFA